MISDFSRLRFNERPSPWPLSASIDNRDDCERRRKKETQSVLPPKRFLSLSTQKVRSPAKSAYQHFRTDSERAREEIVTTRRGLQYFMGLRLRDPAVVVSFVRRNAMPWYGP